MTARRSYSDRALRQTIRGCGALPFVGTHPGAPVMAMISIFGTAAAAATCSVAPLAWVALLPLYLWGAYSRAELSDELVRLHHGGAA